MGVSGFPVLATGYLRVKGHKVRLKTSIGYLVCYLSPSLLFIKCPHSRHCIHHETLSWHIYMGHFYVHRANKMGKKYSLSNW